MGTKKHWYFPQETEDGLAHDGCGNGGAQTWGEGDVEVLPTLPFCVVLITEARVNVLPMQISESMQGTQRRAGSVDGFGGGC